jgi:YVTN family beta-propeller protein
VTKKVYVVNLGSNSVTVIDGPTKATATVAAGAQPNTVAIDKIRNKIYIANGNGLCLTVIDGKTNSTVTFGDIENGSADVAVDVLTNQVFVMTANGAGSTVSIFSGVKGVFPAGLLDRLTGEVSGIR